MALSWYDQLAELLSSAREQTRKAIHEYTPVGLAVQGHEKLASQLPNPEDLAVASPTGESQPDSTLAVAAAAGFAKEAIHQMGLQVEDPVNLGLAALPHGSIPARLALGVVSAPALWEGGKETIAGIKEGDYARAGMGTASVGPALAGLVGAVSPHPAPVGSVGRFRAEEKPFELPKSEPLNPVETPFAPPDEPQFRPEAARTGSAKWWNEDRQKRYDRAVANVKFLEDNPDHSIPPQEVARYKKDLEDQTLMRRAAHGEAPLVDWNPRDNTWKFNGPIETIGRFDNFGGDTEYLRRLGHELQNPTIPSDRPLPASAFFGSDARPRLKSEILAEIDQRLKEAGPEEQATSPDQIPVRRLPKRKGPAPLPKWMEAEAHVRANPAWKTFSDWYRRVSNVNKAKILGQPEDVLPPKDIVSNQVQSVDKTPFRGANFTPGAFARNWTRRITSLSGTRENPQLKFRIESQGHDINILAFMRDMVRDIHKYPNWAEYIGGDTQKLGEELLRRMIWTNAHEIVHSTGVGHPLVDSNTKGVYDFEKQNYNKSWLEGPHTEMDVAHGDHRMYTVMRHAIDAYKGGELDSLIEEARPHLDSWRRLFTEADEISRRPAEAPPVVPPVGNERPVPPPGRPPGNGGGGVPPGGVPGSPGTGGGGPRPPIEGEGPGSNGPPPQPPTGPPFRPSDGPKKIDWGALPGHGIKEWINKRRAALTHGRASRFEFQDIQNEGMDWIAKFEAGQKPKGWERVKALFDKLVAEEQRYGVPIKERANYMYHLWKESPETVRRTYRRLGIRPSFVNARIHETYQEGIKAGLTPKYDNPVDIIAERVRQHKKLIADKGLYNTLRAGRLIKPINKAPQDWIPVRNFPFHRYTVGKSEHVQVWSAPPMVADRLNRYLDPSPHDGFLRKGVQLFTDVKNVVMSAGLPGRAFNAHGINIARRIAGIQDTTAKSFWKSIAEPLELLKKDEASIGKPGPWTKSLDTEASLRKMAFWQEHGATFSIEDHPFKVVEGDVVPKQVKGFWEQVREARDAGKSTIGRNYGGLRKMHELLFEDPLFQGYLPFKKLSFLEEQFTKLKESGLSEKEAAQVAAHQGNVIFGGMNWEGEGGLKGDPQFRMFLRLAFNAPDWAETNLRIGKGAIDWMRNPRDPRTQLYKNIIRNTAMMYVVLRGASQITSRDKQPTERHFQLPLGKASSGRTRYLKPMGTAEDWVRLPYEIIARLAEGDLSGASRVAAARLHPMTQGIVNVVTNRNYWGRPLTGKELPILTQAGRLAHEVTDVAAPSYVKAPVAALAGEAGPEEVLMKSVESPVAYARPDSVGSPHGRGRVFSRRFQRTRNSR